MIPPAASKKCARMGNVNGIGVVSQWSSGSYSGGGGSNGNNVIECSGENGNGGFHRVANGGIAMGHGIASRDNDGE